MSNGLTTLRGIAAFFIVGCHLGLAERTLAGSWVTHFCDMNVGVFGALSGFLMAMTFMRKEVGVRQYVIRRMFKYIPLYLAWSIFYLVASFVFNGCVIRDNYRSLAYWAGALFWGDSATHLWFIASLLYIQMLLAPVLKLIVRKKSAVWIFAFAAAACMVCSVQLGGFYGTYPIRLMSFVLVGVATFLLSEKSINLKVIEITLVALLVGHCVISGVHGFYRDLIVVPAVLLVFAGIERGYGEIAARNSLGVYLVHPFFAAGLAVLTRRFASAPYSVWVVGGEWALVYAISLLVSELMRRNRVLSKLVVA